MKVRRYDCRYCHADALEPMTNAALFRCLVCLRVERAEETLAREWRAKGGMTIGTMRVGVSRYLPDNVALLIRSLGEV
ncbi:MAG: hypothetical protein SFW67_28610 [Myxococcaceae bacterium]|nr:hypothetical protein [Myxococcaceae bacterium]